MKLPCGAVRKRNAPACNPEAAVALIQEKQRAIGTQHHQILQPAIAEIHEQGGGCRVENADSGAVGNVFERSIAPIPVQAIGETARLAHVDLVPAVAVDVSHRDAVVAMNVDPSRRIQTRPPVRYPMGKLRIE